MDSEKNKNFLERLQSADEATKKRWLIVSAAVIMAIVIYVWLAYFNNLVAGFSESGQPVQADSGGEGGVTFWQTMKNGLSVTFHGFTSGLHGLGNILQAPREYIINPPKQGSR